MPKTANNESDDNNKLDEKIKKIVIKVGVIGLGGISANHLLSLSLIENDRKIWGKNKRVKLWALSDIDQKRLDEICKVFPAKHTYTDPYDLIRNPDIDAVYILTPTKFHKEYLIAAANAGKHVFVEKPLALLPKDVDEMINARDNNKVKIQAGLVFRSAPVFEYLKHYTKDNKEKLGKPLNICFRDSQWKPYVGEKDAHGGSTWRKDKDIAHGGSLFEHVIHDIDGMVYLFGDPTSVYSNIRFIAGYEDIEDSVAIIMDFPNEFVVSITATWNNIHFDQRRMEFYYENAYIWLVVDESGIEVKIKFKGEDEETLDLEKCETFYKDLVGKPHLRTEIPGPYYYESIRFFDSIFEDFPCYPSLELGKKAQQIIEYCYESSKQKKTLDIHL